MNSNYVLSFTAMSLMVCEAQKMALLYLENKDWKKVEYSVVVENVLQKSTLATRKREFIELKKRVKSLSDTQLNYFESASDSDTKYLVLLSCFKSYQFIFDFVAENVRNKLLLFDFQIFNSDYESFYESKALLYDNLNTISQTTQAKIKQVLFKILEQAEIIDSVKNKYIQKPYISEELIKLIVQDNPQYLKAFLYNDGEINAFVKRFT